TGAERDVVVAHAALATPAEGWRFGAHWRWRLAACHRTGAIWCRSLDRRPARRKARSWAICRFERQFRGREFGWSPNRVDERRRSEAVGRRLSATHSGNRQNIVSAHVCCALP